MQCVGNNRQRVKLVSDDTSEGKITVNERSKRFTVENFKFLSLHDCGLRNKTYTRIRN